MKRNTWRTLVLSLFLMIVVLFANSSIVQAGEATENNQDTGYGMTVTLQIEGYGYTMAEGVEVKMPDQYKSFADYGLDVAEPKKQGYTVLHVLAQYCVEYLDVETATDMIDIRGGFVYSMFGGELPEQSALMFLLNRESLQDGVAVQKVNAGDLVSMVDIWINSSWTIGGQYGWFEQSQMTVEEKDDFKMKLNATPLMWQETARLGNATVKVYDENNELVTSAITDQAGYVTLSIDKSGTYKVTAERISEYYDNNNAHPYDLTTPHAVVTVIEQIQVTDEEAVQAAKDALTLGDISKVKSDLNLPARGKKDTVITWKSDKPEVISNTGIVTRPVDENATVKMTATISRGEASETKEFEVTVYGYSLGLKTLEVNGEEVALHAEQKDYTVYVSEDTKEITVSAEAEESFPDVWFKMNDNWIFGDNKGTVKVDFPLKNDSLNIPIEVNKTYNGNQKSVTNVTIERKHFHTEETLPAVPATCTQAGKTEGKKCSVCGEILVEQDTIPATGHKMVLVSAKKNATNTANGVTAKYKCSKCDYTQGGTSIPRTSKVTLYKGVNKSYTLTSGKWKLAKTKAVTLKGNKLTVKKTGTVKVTDQKTKQVVTIKILNPSLSVNKKKITLKVGQKFQIVSKATPAKTVRYSSSKKKIATVTGNGLIQAKKKGKTTIYVKANGVVKKVNVSVK